MVRIPQSLAYGILAGVRAENGLYTELFGSIIYALFATGRHNSLGTSSVTGLLMREERGIKNELLCPLIISTFSLGQKGCAFYEKSAYYKWAQ